MRLAKKIDISFGGSGDAPTTDMLPAVMLVHGTSLKDAVMVMGGGESLSAKGLTTKIKKLLTVARNPQNEAGMYLKNTQIPTKEEL